MTLLYEGAKQARLQVASRHSRRTRLSFSLLLSLTFAFLWRRLGGAPLGLALGVTLAWLAVSVALGPFQRRMDRRGRLLRAMVIAFGLDVAYASVMVWALGGSEWLGGLNLVLILALAGLYLPQSGLRWVLGACLGALALLLASPHLGPLAPPAGGPFPALAGGPLAWAVDLSILMVLGLQGWAVFRYSHETSLREDELRSANQRLRGLNEALSDQQFSLLVSQQDLLLANERLRLKNEEVLKSQDVIRTLAQALEARDHYTQGHSSRVSDVAVRLARALGLNREELETVRLGCLLHDVGKIHVPDAVLRKPGALDEEEFAMMRKHPAIGEQICRPLAFARPCLSIIRHHHERWDGRGYPDGLKGEEISLHARIAAVADAWDAMTSDRPYRTALPEAVAFGRLLDGAGTQFDPNMVELFVRVMDHEQGQEALEAPTAPAANTGGNA
jgi:putative nucleotidyltransferase with HDIG domain